MSQTKNHCELLVAVWLRPSTTELCICCKQVAKKPCGDHLKMMYDVCTSHAQHGHITFTHTRHAIRQTCSLISMFLLVLHAALNTTAGTLMALGMVLSTLVYEQTKSIWFLDSSVALVIAVGLFFYGVK